MPLSKVNTAEIAKVTSYKLHLAFRGHSQKFDGRSRNFRGGREYGFRQEDFRQEYRRTLDRSTGGDHAIAIGCVNLDKIQPGI